MSAEQFTPKSTKPWLAEAWKRRRPGIERAKIRRLWSSIAVGLPTECWEWNGSFGSPRKDGYATTKWRGKTTTLHRLLWEVVHGDIELSNMHVDHLCRNRRCLNPRHLELVTREENIRRGTCWSAINARKTHCPKGHPYEGDNLIISRRSDGTPFRLCRACNIVAHRELRARKREAAGREPRRVLSQAEREEALERVAAGERHASIAATFGVSRSAISQLAMQARRGRM